MTLFVPTIVALLNIMISHTMLTRKRSVSYCVVAFVLNAFIALTLLVYLRNIITDDIVFKYIYYLTAFSYIAYISVVFSDSFSIKLFSMFNTWFFSTIAISISNMFYDLSSVHNVDAYTIRIARIVMHMIVLGASYQWYGRYFKKITGKISDSVIYLMSGYMLVAFVILIRESSFNNIGLRNTNSNVEMSLLIAVLISGYLLMLLGISHSTKNSLLNQNMETPKEQLDNYYKLLNYDDLTGVANRQNIMNQISTTIDEFKNESEEYMILIFDIDKFKSINEQYGHVVGDIALKFVVNKVKECLRGDDVIGRLGGNEFIIFPKSIHTKADTEFMVKRIITAFKTPLIIGGKSIIIEISIGISIFPTDSRIMDDLLYKADKAMHEAKKVSGNTYKFFNEL